MRFVARATSRNVHSRSMFRGPKSATTSPSVVRTSCQRVLPDLALRHPLVLPPRGARSRPLADEHPRPQRLRLRDEATRHLAARPVQPQVARVHDPARARLHRPGAGPVDRVVDRIVAHLQPADAVARRIALAAVQPATRSRLSPPEGARLLAQASSSTSTKGRSTYGIFRQSLVVLDDVVVAGRASRGAK